MDKISAQDLRVGNKLNDTHGRVLTVNEIKNNCVGCHYEGQQNTTIEGVRYSSFPYDDLRPIPLTPELLERGGFDGNPNTMTGASLEIKDHERVFKSISIYYNNDTAENQYYLFMREGAKDEPRTNDGVVLFMRNLQYLHQLQNVFFLITTIELDVKM